MQADTYLVLENKLHIKWYLESLNRKVLGTQVTSGKRGDTKVCFVGEVQLNFVIQETARGIAVVC